MMLSFSIANPLLRENEMKTETTIRMTVAERTRQKIVDANIISRLLKHYRGELEYPMDAGQINIGLKLLNKVLPDLKSVDVRGRVDVQIESRLELEGRLLAMGQNPDEVWQSLENRHVIAVDPPVDVVETDSQSVADEAQMPLLIDDDGDG